jgi:hypothetical protein
LRKICPAEGINITAAQARQKGMLKKALEYLKKQINICI